MRICLGHTSGNKETASDLVQEVFINVWNGLGKFREESKISTWIYRIAVNTCLMNLRKNKRFFLKNSWEEEGAVFDELSISKERQYVAMYQCIDTLSTTNKAIILMELEGLPQMEIAEVMGLNHSAVRTRLHRIKIQLSKCVNND